MRKVFVDVTAQFTKDGDLEPVAFLWENGCKYEIDKILDMKKAASLKVGGHGVRYLCRVRNKEVVLFLDNGKWFVEAK
ncbi:MAG: hypothetical protein WCL54_03720 [Clostridia bacterium]